MKDLQSIFLKRIADHRGILLKITKMYMNNERDREDLQQEIIYHLWKSYPNFKEKSQFSTWMYRVAINTAITYLKKQTKRLTIVPLDRSIDIRDQAKYQKNDEQLISFYKAVKELNGIEKALIFLFVEGLSHKEIAINLGIMEGNARVKLNRTKIKLQKIIQKNGYEF